MSVKNSQKSAARQVHAKSLLKKLRPFVTFDYDLRQPLAPQSITKIEKYYAIYNSHIKDARNGIIKYRPKRKDHLKTAQEAGGMDPKTAKQFKVALVPVPQKGANKIKFNKKGKMKIVAKNVTTSFIPLDPFKLLSVDNEDYIKGIVDDNPYPKFSINYGEFSSPTLTKKFIIEDLLELANNDKYAVPGSHHYIGDWLTGIWGLEFTNQTGAEDWVIAKNDAAKLRAKKAAAHRRQKKNTKRQK